MKIFFRKSLKTALCAVMLFAVLFCPLQGCAANDAGSHPAANVVEGFFHSLKSNDVEGAAKFTLLQEDEASNKYGSSFRPHVYEVLRNLGERIRADVAVMILSDKYYIKTGDADVKIALINQKSSSRREIYIRVVNESGSWKIMNYLIIYYSIPK